MNIPVARLDLPDRIRHAESYPFARPSCSYLFKDGGMYPLPPNACAGRLPIVASGSNASPERLLAKFGKIETIPVTRAELRHFVVVFAGHFTAYGAIPATLCPHRWRLHTGLDNLADIGPALGDASKRGGDRLP